MSDESTAKTESHDPDFPEKFLEFMRTGWRDDSAGRHPGPRPRRATPTGARRCPPQFPGETSGHPTGTEKTRANDTDYPVPAGQRLRLPDRRPRPRQRAGHAARTATGTTRSSTPAPRSSRETDEFFRSRDGELWVGRRQTLAEKAGELGLETAALADLEKALADCAPRRTRVLRGLDPEVDAAGAAVERQGREGREVQGPPHPRRRAGRCHLRAEAGQGRVGDRPAAGRDRRDRPRLRGRRPDPAGRPGASRSG